MESFELISRKHAAIVEAALLQQLQDAHVHLGELLTQMSADEQIDEAELGIRLGRRHLAGDVAAAGTARAGF